MYIVSDGVRLQVKLDLPEGMDKEKDRCDLVLLIHGFTGHMEEAHIVAVSKAATRAGYACLRAEMYGHGGSGGEFKNHTLLKWMGNALDLVDYARQLPFVRRLFLCGHSQGGLMVMLTAAMEADRISGLIPLSPAWMIPERAREGDLLGIRFDPVHVPDVLCLEDGRELSGNYARTAARLYVEPAIEQYGGPVLIIHGDQDETVPYSCGVKAARLYKNASLVTIEGDNHCYDNHLDQVAEAVRSWLLLQREA